MVAVCHVRGETDVAPRPFLRIVEQITENFRQLIFLAGKLCRGCNVGGPSQRLIVRQPLEGVDDLRPDRRNGNLLPDERRPDIGARGPARDRQGAKVTVYLDPVSGNVVRPAAPPTNTR